MEVERMLLLRIGMGHSWRARRCVVLGYGGLMEGESHGSGLLETDNNPCNTINVITKRSSWCQVGGSQIRPCAAPS